MAGVYDYSTNPDNNGVVATVPYFPEGQLADSLNDAARQVMADIATMLANAMKLPAASTVVDPTGVARLIGYADVPLIDLSTSPYTLVLADRGVARRLITGSGTVTIPLNATAAFPISTIIGGYNHTASTKTISMTSGGTLRLHGSTATPTATKTVAARGWYWLTKVDVDEWSAQGDVT